MAKKVPFNGNQATAFAMKQIDPDVVAAYPITPQTEINQTALQQVEEAVGNFHATRFQDPKFFRIPFLHK